MLLPVQKAGPVPNITVEGKNTITLTDLLAGDVWVCSGQSNMAMTLQKGPWCGYGGALNAEQEVAAANHPQIRFYKGKAGEWEVCSPETARSFSAAGYFFGRELHRRLGVPVGMVQAAIGATMAESWTPRSVREATPAFAKSLAMAQRVIQECKEDAAADAEALAQWTKAAARAKQAGQPAPPKPANKLNGERWDLNFLCQQIVNTGCHYEGRILPLTAMPIKGVIWYQGEGDTTFAPEYAELMALLIGGWRQRWGQGDFPFLIMQLVNFTWSPSQPWRQPGSWADLRDQQQKTVDTVPNTGLAIGYDIGDPGNIHPRNKQEVGRRLALVALKHVYGQDVVASGPRLTETRPEVGKVVLSFDPRGKDQRLVFKNGMASGFELAGADGKCNPATAEVKENTVTLTAPAVTDPRAVRYAWLDNPPATLFNTAGLPAAPFQRPTTRDRKSGENAFEAR